MRRILLCTVLILLAGCASPAAAPGDTATATSESSGTPVTHDERPDPDSDQLGWENGYWHDDPIAVDASDGLNATERTQVINRAMARVEVVRNVEFDRDVNVSVVSRGNFSADSGGGSTDAALRAFDNAKFEALFLIGNERDSIADQSDTRNQTVGGFYSPARGDIVLVSNSDSPELDGERTLAHELVHALQDQAFDLSGDRPASRDAYNGRNGLIEGDASAVENAYLDRCGEEWDCLAGETASQSQGDDESPSINLGVYILDYFPYSDGPGLIAHLRDGDDWSAVNDAFDTPPGSAVEVIHPERYGEFEPRTASLADRTSGDWERVRPEGRPDHGVIGQSGLTAMFAYTLYDDYNQDSVVSPQAFLNLDGGTVNMSDPFNYALPAVDGWTGDRFHAYERGDDRGYVWRLTWENSSEAREFTRSYRQLLGHWGGTTDSDGVWTIAEDSPFAGAVDVSVDGDVVTIVKAPTESALDGVRRESG